MQGSLSGHNAVIIKKCVDGASVGTLRYSGSPFTNTNELQPQYVQVITSIMRFGLQLLIDSQTFTWSHWTLGMVPLFYPTLYWAYDYLSMMLIKDVQVVQVLIMSDVIVDFQYWCYCPKSSYGAMDKIVTSHSEPNKHYGDIIMGAIASQITSLIIV